MAEMEFDPDTGLALREPPPPWPFGLSSVAQILEIGIASQPDQAALVDGERSWTYRQLDTVVNAAAHSLAVRDVGVGDRIVWCLPNSAELIIGFLATCRLGAIWAGVNPSSPATEQNRVLADLDPTLCIGTATAGAVSIVDLALEWADSRPQSSLPVDPHAPGAIAYTSGSTGEPKGVVHSQHNLLSQAAASIATDQRLDDERHGSPLSLSILNIMVLGPITAFARAASYHVLTSTRSRDFAHDVDKEQVTHTLVVPTMVHDLVERDDVSSEQLATLRTVLIGGSNAPPALRRRFHARFGVRAVASYGLSEAPGGVVREPTGVPVRSEGVGFAQIHVDVTIDSEAGGEICVSPAAEGVLAGCWTAMLGYWRRPDLTAEALDGNVLHTGDVGTIDDDGWVTVTGRLSQVIIRGGANVMPAEVEAALITHEGVAEAVVFGLEDDRLGERVVACVAVTRATGDADLLRHCSELLAAHKVPDLVLFVDALQRNAMGKVDLTGLRELARHRVDGVR